MAPLLGVTTLSVSGRLVWISRDVGRERPGANFGLG